MVASNNSSQVNLMTILSAKRAILSDNGILIKDQTQLYQSDNASFVSYLSCSSAASAVSDPVKSIPYPDILSARFADPKDQFVDSDYKDVEVVYAKRYKNYLVPKSTTLKIEALNINNVVDEIYLRSYRGSSPKKSILVLVNPHGGKGKALKLFLTKAKPILDAAEARVEMRETEYSRHATEIMKELDISKYDIVGCASGDGIPYEVFNGLYQRPDRAKAFDKIAITQIPCGSGNAMSESCHGTGEPSFAALSLLKAQTVNIDLMAVTQDDKTSVSFLSQTLGIIADSDIDTEHLRFLGSKRFDLGVAYKVFSRAKYPCEIYVKYAAKSKDDLREFFEKHVNTIQDKTTEITDENFELKYDANGPVPDDWVQVDPDIASNLGIFYTGKMPYISKDVQFFPAALPNDGTFDLIMLDARTSITRQTPILLSLESGKHVHAPEIQHSKAYAYRLKPRYTKGLLSIDGERYASREIQVEVLPGAAKTLLKNGSYVETSF